jgi:hypothetical protein
MHGRGNGVMGYQPSIHASSLYLGRPVCCSHLDCKMDLVAAPMHHALHSYAM